MTMHYRRLLPFAFVALAAPSLQAQSVFDSEFRLAPQFVQYKVKSAADETITELAIPAFVVVPFGSRFTLDIGTSFARARVQSGNTVSEISGLTDTQVRGNLTLGSDFVVLTAGVNLPSGKASVDANEVTAAGRIGSDFLAFPISNMGTGFAGTAGIAVARPFGDWNVGFGGAMRRSNSYDPGAIAAQPLRFQPGDEYRARLGVDRPVRSGRLSLGVTYSAFGDDDAGGSVYNTGDRVIAQAVLTSILAGNDMTLAAYNVFRSPGKYASGDPSGRENIANVFLSVGLRPMGRLVEPSIELRHWLQNVPGSTSGSVTIADRSQSNVLATLGLRTNFAVGGFSALPSVGYTVGSLSTVDAAQRPTTTELTGYRASLTIRIAP